MPKFPAFQSATANTLPRWRWRLSLLPRLSTRGVIATCLGAAMLAPSLGRLDSAAPQPFPTANPAVQNALHQLTIPSGPVGNQFQVNSYTNGPQRDPALALDSDGDFVVVWQSTGSSGPGPGGGPDSDGDSIQGQRYNAAGEAQGSQFQVNSYTTGNQRDPAVALDSDGDFVVIWESRGSSGSDNEFYSIQGQRYSAAGVAQGSQFQVNSYATGSQFLSAVAMDSDGDFVVAWMSYGSSGSDTAYTSIQGQRYNAIGVAQGSQFQVNSVTSNFQRFPAVALDSDGDFVIVWDSNIISNIYSTEGQRYNAAGVAQGGQFRVNTYTTYSHYAPAVAIDSDGNFVVVWDNASNAGIEGQRYNAAGTPQGSNFRVTDYNAESPRNAAVAMDSDGDFVVAWESIPSYGGDPDNHSIQARGYNAAGVPQGSQFRVNSYTIGSQRLPAVALDSAGDFVVVWDSDGSPGSDSDAYSIQGQRFADVIFTPTSFLYLPAVVND